MIIDNMSLILYYNRLPIPPYISWISDMVGGKFGISPTTHADLGEPIPYFFLLKTHSSGKGETQSSETQPSTTLANRIYNIFSSFLFISGYTDKFSILETHTTWDGTCSSSKLIRGMDEPYMHVS